MIRSTFHALLRSIIALTLAIISTGLLQAASLTSSEASSIFSSANAAYRAEKFDEAKAGYKQLLDGGFKTPTVLYNMGTAAARLNQNDEAIGYLTFASRLDPHNADVEVNLARARKLQSASASTPVEQNYTFVERLLDSLTSSEWLLLCWIPLVLFCTCVSILALTRKPLLVRSLKPAAYFFGLLFIFLVIPATIQVYRTRIVPESIALASAEVHSGPGKSFTVLTTLKPGDLLHSPVLSEASDFRAVHLPDGRKGYVEAESILPLR